MQLDKAMMNNWIYSRIKPEHITTYVLYPLFKYLFTMVDMFFFFVESMVK